MDLAALELFCVEKGAVSSLDHLNEASYYSDHSKKGSSAEVSMGPNRWRKLSVMTSPWQQARMSTAWLKKGMNVLHGQHRGVRDVVEKKGRKNCCICKSRIMDIHHMTNACFLDMPSRSTPEFNHYHSVQALDLRSGCASLLHRGKRHKVYCRG